METGRNGTGKEEERRRKEREALTVGSAGRPASLRPAVAVVTSYTGLDTAIDCTHSYIHTYIKKTHHIFFFFFPVTGLGWTGVLRWVDDRLLGLPMRNKK